MTDLCASGAITDLVVCTLLRINSVYTKESLGKALFNLMSRVEFRQEMVVKLDVLTAMLGEYVCTCVCIYIYYDGAGSGWL